MMVARDRVWRLLSCRKCNEATRHDWVGRTTDSAQGTPQWTCRKCDLTVRGPEPLAEQEAEAGLDVIWVPRPLVEDAVFHGEKDADVGVDLVLDTRDRASAQGLKACDCCGTSGVTHV